MALARQKSYFCPREKILLLSEIKVLIPFEEFLLIKSNS
jgi:hypothetical protein